MVLIINGEVVADSDPRARAHRGQSQSQRGGAGGSAQAGSSGVHTIRSSRPGTGASANRGGGRVGSRGATQTSGQNDPGFIGQLESMLGIRGSINLPEPIGPVKNVALLLFVVAAYFLGIRVLALAVVYVIVKNSSRHTRQAN